MTAIISIVVLLFGNFITKGNVYRNGAVLLQVSVEHKVAALIEKMGGKELCKATNIKLLW